MEVRVHGYCGDKSWNAVGVITPGRNNNAIIGVVVRDVMNQAESVGVPAENIIVVITFN